MVTIWGYGTFSLPILLQEVNSEHLRTARYIRLHLGSFPKFSGLIIYTPVVQVVES